MVLRGVDRQIGLTERLARVFNDRRYPGYINHPLAALFVQRIYQIGCAYEDGNDANTPQAGPTCLRQASVQAGAQAQASGRRGGAGQCPGLLAPGRTQPRRDTSITLGVQVINR